MISFENLVKDFAKGVKGSKLACMGAETSYMHAKHIPLVMTHDLMTFTLYFYM